MSKKDFCWKTNCKKNNNEYDYKNESWKCYSAKQMLLIWYKTRHNLCCISSLFLVSFAHLLIFHSLYQLILSPFHHISPHFSLVVLYFSLSSVSPLLAASRWQTDSWMADGQNKETQMWTIIFPLTHVRCTRLSPGSPRVSEDRGCWWSRGIGPWKSSHLRGGNKMAVAESRFDYRARRREVWLAVECRQCD